MRRPSRSVVATLLAVAAVGGAFAVRPAESQSLGELAEKWSWQDNYRNLVFFLRKGAWR